MRKFRQLSLGAVALWAVALVLSLWTAMARSPDPDPPDGKSSPGDGGQGGVVGKPAPSFVIETRDGKRLTSRELRGKVVVLNLWASWCPPCLEELPSLERLRRQVAGAGVEIIGVSVDTAWEDVDKVVEETGAGFVMALDPEQKVARAFGTSKFPETYIIDPRQTVVRKLIGEQIWDRGDFVTFLKALAK